MNTGKIMDSNTQGPEFNIYNTSWHNTVNSSNAEYYFTSIINENTGYHYLDQKLYPFLVFLNCNTNFQNYIILVSSIIK